VAGAVTEGIAEDPDRPPRGAAAVAIGLGLLGFGPLLILVLLVAAIGLLTPSFVSAGNIGNIIAQTAVIAIVAVGQHIVILTRGIDLSVGANLALATVIGGLVFRQVDSAPLVMLAMLATGVAVGAVNGLVYVFGRLPHPFIITLATLSIARGLALELSIGHTTMRGMPEAIATIGGGSSFGLPNSFFVVLAVAGTVALMAKRMVWGRWIYAVGAAPQAAREMGIPVRGVLVSTYLLELDTIAAVIIGGASFLGGRGHVGHALIGAVMIGVIRNALNLMNVSVFFQMIAIGVVIVVAVEADVLRNYLEGRARNLQARAQ